MCTDLSTLMGLTFRGDLEGFLAAWEYCFMALKKTPDDDMLFAIVDTQLRKCKALGPAFVIYDDALKDSEQRSSK